MLENFLRLRSFAQQSHCRLDISDFAEIMEEKNIEIHESKKKVDFYLIFREDYREGRRAGRGVLMRGGRAAQVIAQESMEEHIRGSVEKLDNQFSTLHQDVATLSCEVIYTNIITTLRYFNLA